ncbi:unnamed protein product, partial [Effrenium voratum]
QEAENSSALVGSASLDGDDERLPAGTPTDLATPKKRIKLDSDETPPKLWADAESESCTTLLGLPERCRDGFTVPNIPRKPHAGGAGRPHLTEQSPETELASALRRFLASRMVTYRRWITVHKEAAGLT